MLFLNTGKTKFTISFNAKQEQENHVYTSLFPNWDFLTICAGLFLFYSSKSWNMFHTRYYITQ